MFSYIKMLGTLIVSIISILVVVGTATTIYVQNVQQAKRYDDELKEVVNKANVNNQYGYERNKDQDYVLDELYTRASKMNQQLSKIGSDFTSTKSQQQKDIQSIKTNLSSLQSSTAQDISALQNVNKTQHVNIITLNDSLASTNNAISTINNQVKGIGTQLTTIGTKQQTQLDTLNTNDQNILKEQGNIRDSFYKVKSDLTDQQNVLNISFNALTDRANKIQASLTTTINNLSALTSSLNKYVKKADADSTYATISDMTAVDNKFAGYVTNVGFSNYQNSLPEYATKVAMDDLANVYATIKKVNTVSTSLSDTQQILSKTQAQLQTLSENYKPMLAAITSLSQSTAQGAVDINSMNAAMKVVQQNLTTLLNQINTVNGALNDYKTLVDNKYAVKVDVANINTALTNQITTLSASLNDLRSTLQTQDWFVGRQYVAAGNNAVVMNSAGQLKAMDSVIIGDNASLMNSAGLVRGNSMVAAGAGNNSFMDSTGKIWGSDSVRARNLVAVGDSNNAYMNKTGLVYGTSLEGRDAIKVTGDAARLLKDGSIYGNTVISRDNVKLANESAVMTSDGLIKGNSRITAGLSNNSFMDGTGKIWGSDSVRAKNMVAVGDENTAYMNQSGVVYGTSLQGRDAISVTGETARMSKDGTVAGINVTARDKISVGDQVIMNKDGSFRAGQTYLGHTDGSTYIRPGTSGANVFVGDTITNRVQIGSASSKTTLAGQTYLNDNPLYLRNDTSTGLQYSTDVSGPKLFGTSGGALATTNKVPLTWSDDGRVVVNDLRAGPVSATDTYPQGWGGGILGFDAYMRGSVMVGDKAQNNTLINGTGVQTNNIQARQKLCVGNTCIDEVTLQSMLKVRSGQPVRLQSVSTGNNIENGGVFTLGNKLAANPWDNTNNKRWLIYGA